MIKHNRQTQNMPALPFYIRPFKRADMEFILSIEDASFGKDAYGKVTILDWFQRRGDWFFVAVSQQEITGYIVGAVEGQEGIIISLAVAPENRQSGVASALLQDLKHRFRETGMSNIKLHVRTTNQDAIRLYSKFGFAIKKTILNYYNDGAQAYCMILQL